MELVVGRVGRAHGVRGDVAVEIRTDAPDERFAVGSSLRTQDGRDLEVAAARWHSGRLLVRFAGVGDRESAQGLSGRLLSVEASPDEATGDPDEFFDHQLVGLRVTDTGGEVLGEVADVLHLPAQEVLAVRVPTETGATAAGTTEASITEADRDEVLVPFVSDVVPTVDLANGVVVVDPPEGMF